MFSFIRATAMLAVVPVRVRRLEIRYLCFRPEFKESIEIDL